MMMARRFWRASCSARRDLGRCDLSRCDLGRLGPDRPGSDRCGFDSPDLNILAIKGAPSQRPAEGMNGLLAYQRNPGAVLQPGRLNGLQSPVAAQTGKGRINAGLQRVALFHQHTKVVGIIALIRRELADDF